MMIFQHLNKKIVLFIGAIGLASCGIMPADGPRRSIVATEAGAADEANAPFRVVHIRNENVGFLQEPKKSKLFSRFGKTTKVPASKIHTGDTVVISMWEASNGATPSSLPNALPPQTIGQDGFVKIPFIERINAIDLTPNELATKIQNSLKGNFLDPQVIVTVQQSATQAVTVIGDAVTSARVPLNDKGNRILEILAQSGGVKLPAHEVLVRVVRKGASETVRLQDILDNPSENIYMQPDDTIYFLKNAPTATVMGAVRGNLYLELDNPNATLSDLLAKAGGLSNLQADPSAVYVFRFENQTILEKFDVNSTSKKPEPIIYRVDMGTASGYFVAKSFPMQDKDLIYVATATASDVQNFFNILRSGTAAIKGTDTLIQ